MKKEWKQRWLKALESGEYRKAREMLRRGQTNQMCCLGVLCDLSGLGEWSSSGAYEIDDVRRGSYPHTEVLRRVGLREDQARKLADVNDRQAGYPLDDIRALPED